MDERRGVGISNRETPDEEARERQQHPAARPPYDQSENEAGERTPDDVEPGDVQTSSKAGARSAAQKQAGAKYTDRPAPPSGKVAGAFGKESE